MFDRFLEKASQLRAAGQSFVVAVVVRYQAKYTSDYRGNSFYFCCPRCKQTFDQQPEKYPLVHSR